MQVSVLKPNSRSEQQCSQRSRCKNEIYLLIYNHLNIHIGVLICTYSVQVSVLKPHPRSEQQCTDIRVPVM